MERYDYIASNGLTGFYININNGGGAPNAPWEEWINGEKAYVFRELKRDSVWIYLFDDLRLLDIKIPLSGGDIQFHWKETAPGEKNPWNFLYSVHKTNIPVSLGFTDRRTPLTNSALEIHPAIIHKWARSGGSASLGWPTQSGRCPDFIGYFAHFRHANGMLHSIYWTPATGAHIVKGAIRAKWESLGWERTFGYPISDEFYIAGTAISIFQNVTKSGNDTLTLGNKNAIIFSFVAGIAKELTSISTLASLGVTQFTGLSTVNPKLAFFQNAFPADFKPKADAKANRIRAFGNPKISNPFLHGIGSTPYNSGGDIVSSIEAAYFCSGMSLPVDEIHAFGHGEGMGLYAKPGNQFLGLYVSEVYINKPDREGGGCGMDSIPSFPFADNVVFVLHSCGEAEQQFFGPVTYGPFAQQLYEHLKRSGLNNPSVYGQTRHHQWKPAQLNGKAVWVEYSNRYPNGGPKTIGLPGYEQL